MLAASQEQRMEGVVAKRLGSTYRPGQRSPDWRKIKTFRTQEIVIAGRRTGKGLQFVGGSGPASPSGRLRDLQARLAPHRRVSLPFARPLTTTEQRDAHWVEPALVGEVPYAEWTGDGQLRHPLLRGLRPDKSPEDVTREVKR